MSHSSENHHHSHHSDAPKAKSYGRGVLVYLCLLVLTVVMVGCASLALSSPIKMFLILSLATVQGALVLIYFMNLIDEDKSFWVLGSVALVTLLIIIGFTFFDYSFRTSLFE